MTEGAMPEVYSEKATYVLERLFPKAKIQKRTNPLKIISQKKHLFSFYCPVHGQQETVPIIERTHPYGNRTFTLYNQKVKMIKNRCGLKIKPLNEKPHLIGRNIDLLNKMLLMFKALEVALTNDFELGRKQFKHLSVVATERGILFILHNDVQAIDNAIRKFDEIVEEESRKWSGLYSKSKVNLKM